MLHNGKTPVRTCRYRAVRGVLSKLQEMHCSLQDALHHVQWQRSGVSAHRKALTTSQPETWVKITGRKMVDLMTDREAESQAGGGNEKQLA